LLSRRLNAVGLQLLTIQQVWNPLLLWRPLMLYFV
jgi:hypothetical protein